MEVWFNSRKVADAWRTQLYLQPIVGAYELRFSVQYRVLHKDKDGPIRQAAIHGARASMRTSAGDHQLGFARLDTPVHLRQEDSERTHSSTFVLPLSPPQISALEDLRGGDDLSLHLALSGVGQDSLNTMPLDQTWDVPIPQSEWIRMLREGRARDVLLIEIPMPLVDAPEWLKRVKADLTKAQGLFHSADYVGCVGACRRVVEEIGHRAYGERWADSLLVKLAGGRNSMTKEEREGAIIATIQHYTHPAHHAESRGGEHYTRAEAKLTLSLAATVAARAAG